MADSITPLASAPLSSGSVGSRESPHNIDAEQALLGAILITNDAYYRVSDFLLSEHFFEPLHRRIYELAAQMIDMGKRVNPITIKTFLPEEEKIGDITVAVYLARLASQATTIINAEDYGRSIYDLSIRRQLIGIGEDMVNIAYDAPIDMGPSQQIEDTERRLYGLAEHGKYGGGFSPFPDALSDAISMASAAHERSGHLSGMATGLRTLDEKMGGLQNSDLVIIAGRPAMGKTSLATNIAYNIASAYEFKTLGDGSSSTTDGGIVGFFSLEMAAEQLATRIIAEQTEISSSVIRRGKLTQAEFEKLVHCRNEINHLPLYIDQTGGITLGQLAARARRLKRQKGLDVLIIDYLQLMQSGRRGSDNRVQEITEITTGLKALAKELGIPVIALSQLSRQVESRDDKRPQLSDLRESGSIEQDADIVLFVYREEYYLQNREPDVGSKEYEKWHSRMDEVRGKADVIIAKQRHGPTGIVPLSFQAQYTRFSDLSHSNYEDIES